MARLPLRRNPMELLPKDIRASLPPLGGQDDAADPIAYVKYFTADAGWTWYATEGSAEGDAFIFFGYVIGVAPEWGYFSLAELQSVRGRLGLPAERDLHFTPRPVSAFVRE
jgi:Protein of unknown function (DUF2958)